MRKVTQKHLLDTFSEKLDDNFLDYCNKYGQEKDINSFITFVLDLGLIPPSNIRKYAIQATFEELAQKQQGSKTQTVHLLAERFNLSVRSIWNLLRD